MNNFIKKWHKLREEKQSNIVAGLDPAEFAMGRGESGLPEGANKLEWSLAYIDAVAPYVVAIKPNAGYFLEEGDYVLLQKIVERSRHHGLLTIMDAKISDIGSTSDAWMYAYQELGFDAVTIAPYAGNAEQMIEYGHDRGIAIITMGLMSNPEYKTEMNFRNKKSIALWQDRIQRAVEAESDGLVVGGTYTLADKEHMNFVTMTKDSEILYLIPGIGHQGGKIEEFLVNGIDIKRCMISSGRNVLFPSGSMSLPSEQAKAAKELRDVCNSMIK